MDRLDIAYTAILELRIHMLKFAEQIKSVLAQLDTIVEELIDDEESSQRIVTGKRRRINRLAGEKRQRVV